LYKFLEQTAGENMTTTVKTVTGGLTMRELGKLFDLDNFNTYPVKENEHVVGLVSKFDYLACFVFTPDHILPRYEELMDRTVAEVMTTEFIYVGKETKLTRVLQLMVDHRIRSMPVIEADRRLSGVISRDDVMRALTRCTGEAV
jgi:CBS domain-containing protein